VAGWSWPSAERLETSTTSSAQNTDRFNCMDPQSSNQRRRASSLSRAAPRGLTAASHLRCDGNWDFPVSDSQYRDSARRAAKPSYAEGHRHTAGVFLPTAFVRQQTNVTSRQQV